MGGYQSGQMGQTVTLLSQDFEGSNPSPPTTIKKPVHNYEPVFLFLSPFFTLSSPAKNLGFIYLIILYQHLMLSA